MYFLKSSLLASVLVSGVFTTAQSPAPFKIQTSVFNSSFSLSPAQIEAAQLSQREVIDVNLAINYERSGLANGGPSQDDFYTPPPLKGGVVPRPGTLLKVQPVTNLTSFSIASGLALSRILYTTVNTNGTTIPASAYILWPFQPRVSKRHTRNRTETHVPAPVALWAHGTSGFFANGGPSSYRALWYDYNAPYALALAGYAVVAPDFAGLGVGKSWDNSTIPHQYLVCPTSALDALYSLQAAHKAFPGLLDDRFVSIGHSQGGGTAWSVAEQIAAHPELGPGYLGSVAVSPITTALRPGFELLVPFVSLSVGSIFPEFKPSDWLTPFGVARRRLTIDVQSTQNSGAQTFLNTDREFVKPEYVDTWTLKAFNKLASAGRRNFKGPLLVVQGTEDPFILANLTAATADATHAQFPGNDLELLVVNGTGHTPTLHASQRYWLDWIGDRFDSVKPKQGYTKTPYESYLPIDQYQKLGLNYVQWAGAPEFSYAAPLNG